MGKIRIRIGLALSLLSIALLLLITSCYVFQWDRVAALTNFPIWAPCLLGLGLSAVAHLLFAARLGLTSLLLWLVALIALSDEPRALLNWAATRPEPTRHELANGKPLIRVITLNCGSKRNSLAVEQISAYQPDIVFLQEVISSAEARKLKQALYGEAGDLKVMGSCAILCRHPLIEFRQVPKLRSVIAVVEWPNGSKLSLFNLHLSSATTRMDLWNPEAWEDHFRVRQQHHKEMQDVVHALNHHPQADPQLATLIAGDFNSPAGNPIFEPIEDEFTDAFASAGKGWSNTYPAKFPLLRLDYILNNSLLNCRGATVIQVDGSDHRMIVADFQFQ